MYHYLQCMQIEDRGRKVTVFEKVCKKEQQQSLRLRENIVVEGKNYHTVHNYLKAQAAERVSWD